MSSMARDESNNSSSNNGSRPSAGGFSPDVFFDEADRLEVEAQHARFEEVLKELEAKGVDGTEEYERLFARAANWSSASSS
jgi:hypothetical protein